METYDSKEVLDFASEAGRILLENGAEISRVEETMERIASHYGQREERFFVLSNGIFTTGSAYAHVEFIPIKGSRLDRVVDVNQLSREIESRNLSLPQARARLEEIKAKQAKKDWEQYLGACFGCAGFCIIFGGSFSDSLCSLIAALLLNVFLLKIGNPFLSKTLGNICAGFLGTLLCILLLSCGIGDNLGNMIVGTLILLIPGVAFTNGLRDIANEDYLAGMTRLADALMMFLCIAIGVCFAFIFHSALFKDSLVLNGTVTDPITSSFPIQLAAAFIGTFSFAILFGVPRRYYVACGLVGMLGWALFLIATRYTSAQGFMGTALGAALVALLSRYAAKALTCPSTVFLICGIVPLIPGGGVFWSAYYVAAGDVSTALSCGMNAVKITLAIVIVLIISANIFHSEKWRMAPKGNNHSKNSQI